MNNKKQFEMFNYFNRLLNDLIIEKSEKYGILFGKVWGYKVYVDKNIFIKILVNNNKKKDYRKILYSLLFIIDNIQFNNILIKKSIREINLWIRKNNLNKTNRFLLEGLKWLNENGIIVFKTNNRDKWIIIINPEFLYYGFPKGRKTAIVKFHEFMVDNKLISIEKKTFENLENETN